MVTQNQKRIQENLYLFEQEKKERLKSLPYRISLYWYLLKKKMKNML